MSTPLERLQGIRDKFNKAVDPSAYMKAKPQVVPGSAATKIMLNQPGTAGIKPPAPAKGGVKLPSNLGLRAYGAFGLTEAQTPKERFVSGMTITNPIMGTTLGVMDAVQNFMSGFTGTQGAEFQGRGEGRAAFNKPEAKPSSLPSLKPGDDIPKSQYPAGVSTGVGGGNAAQAQSVNPEATGYIPPTGKPLSVGTDTSSGGREVVTDADEAMRIWAQTHGGLADKVIDKVENRGLKQAGYDIIKSVRQPGQSASFPVDMAGEKVVIPYADDKSGTEALNREGFEGIPAEIKTKDATSEFSPAFGAEDFLKNYMSGLKGKDSADYSVNSLSTPAELQDPVVMPAGNVDFNVPEVKNKLKRRN